MPEYVFTAYLHYDARPSDFWVATLEHSSAEAIESGEIEQLADDFVAGLRLVALTNVVIDRVTISTWAPDSEPYDPDALRVIPYGVFGTRTFALTDPVDDDIVLFVRKQVTTGRSGKFQFRGWGTVNEMTTAAGAWTLTGAALAFISAAVEDMWLAISANNSPSLIGVSLLRITYPATAEGEKQIPVRVYEATPRVRTVTGLQLVGPTERQDNQ